MSKEKLLSATVESEHIHKNLLENGLEKIAKVQNLSQNELEQITKMQNLLQNKLEQIVKTRRIKNYKDMPREDLLIALLKSNQSHAELRRSGDNNAEIKETEKINELTNNFSKEEIKKIRRKFRFRESTDKYLKELEEKDSLTEQEKTRKKTLHQKITKG